MRIAGIIAEYNPFHQGHILQMEMTRALLGEDTAVVCVMSGNFVQRGDFAIIRKHARAAAAVCGGADLVLELPLPWAVSSAERFADGGVQTLIAAGCVTHLSFGSECGDAAALLRVADGLTDERFPALLRQELTAGVGFAAARQRAAETLLGAADAALLSAPNNILGIEYGKSLRRHASSIVPVTIPRQGAAHDGAPSDGIPSASAVRDLLRKGREDEALSLLPPAMAGRYREEWEAGRAPVFSDPCERAVLARLRSMHEEDFALLDEGGEGLYHRIYRASRSAASLGELISASRTKRYAASRLRRMVLWAYLGLTPADVPEEPPYLRVLAANGRGREVLKRMRQTARIPLLIKPADVRSLSGAARRLFALEVRATDLYALAYPDLAAARGGSEWREGPVIL